MTGRLIAVVGPSGVGKDSLMAGLKATMPDLHIVRRVITRTAGTLGEAFDAVSEARFDTMVQDGAFALHWHAHGLSYGIPSTTLPRLDAGTDCAANLSRGVLLDAAEIFDRLVVLNVTATKDTLAYRLKQRGRETDAQIAARLSRAATPLPAGLTTMDVFNDGPLEDSIARAAVLLRPENVT